MKDTLIVTKLLLAKERDNTRISIKYTAVKDPAIAQNKSLVGEASTGSQCSWNIELVVGVKLGMQIRGISPHWYTVGLEY